MANDAVTKPLQTIEIDVRWGDMDAFEHVNNAVYFSFFEQVRAAWLERIYPDWMTTQDVPILVTASCNFVKPLTYPATVRVSVSCAEPGRSSLRTLYEMRDGETDEVYATGEAVVVWIDKTTGKSTPLPEAMRSDIDAHRL